MTNQEALSYFWRIIRKTQKDMERARERGDKQGVECLQHKLDVYVYAVQRMGG